MNQNLYRDWEGGPLVPIFPLLSPNLTFGASLYVYKIAVTFMFWWDCAHLESISYISNLNIE